MVQARTPGARPTAPTTSATRRDRLPVIAQWATASTARISVIASTRSTSPSGTTCHHGTPPGDVHGHGGQDRHEAEQREHAERARPPCVPPPARIGTPPPAEQQCAYRQAEEGDHCARPVHVPARARAHGPVVLGERRHQQQADRPQAEGERGAGAHAHHPDRQQCGEQRHGAHREHHHGEVEQPAVLLERVVADGPAKQVHALARRPYLQPDDQQHPGAHGGGPGQREPTGGQPARRYEFGSHTDRRYRRIWPGCRAQAGTSRTHTLPESNFRLLPLFVL